MSADTVSAVEHVSVLYRSEIGSTAFSWKLKAASAVLQGLFSGSVLPEIGEIVEVNGTSYAVKERVPNLQVVTGDLAARDRFDKRRIYKTPQGSLVVFKRLDTDGRAVLWSYAKSVEIKVTASMLLEPTDQLAKPVAVKKKRFTQKLLAAYLISKNPDITAKELTIQLQAAFPNHDVGNRHGPHYLSLSKQGRLDEAPDRDPREEED